MAHKAIFPGSFDPFTLGHREIAERALGIFDALVVLVAVNSAKSGMFAPDRRVELAMMGLQGLAPVEVIAWEGLTADYMKQNGIKHLVRGVRNGSDLDWESQIAWNNSLLEPGVDTVLFPSSRVTLHVSSSIVRELLRHGRDASHLLPSALAAELCRKQENP